MYANTSKKQRDTLTKISTIINEKIVPLLLENSIDSTSIDMLLTNTQNKNLSLNLLVNLNLVPITTEDFSKKEKTLRKQNKIHTKRGIH